MSFQEKLNALMSTQGVTNSRLAKALSVDPSLVSRWRNGSRTPLKNPEFIRFIASYFVNIAKRESQKASLLELLSSPVKTAEKDADSLADLLARWLAGDSLVDTAGVKSFIERVGSFTAVRQPARQAFEPESPPALSAQTAVNVYRGIEGKRECALRFLSLAAARTKPMTLLLYSDERLEWLTEDKSFYIKWGNLLSEIISKGHRIKIVHTIVRDLTEMLAGIERWLPLYMTGCVEPYYYPRYQEYIFKRTMYIAPETAVVYSNSFAGTEADSLQYFSTEPVTVSAMTEEYNHFLSMCSPLMKIVTQANYTQGADLSLEFEEQPGESVTMSWFASAVTMPEELFRRIVSKLPIEHNESIRMLNLYHKRVEIFRDSLKQNKHTDIVVLPEDGADPVLQDSIFGRLPYPSYHDYLEHLSHMIQLLKENENYSVVLQTGYDFPDVYVSAREETGVIIARHGLRPILFAFNERNMTYAFLSYLSNQILAIPEAERSKSAVIQKLSGFITSQGHVHA